MRKSVKTVKGTLLGKNRYFYLSPPFSHQLTINLALMINQEIKKGNLKKPDVVVAIAKGAFSWARSLADWLNIPELSSLQIVHYQGVERRFKKAIVLQSLPIRVQGRSLLVFDDVVETGKTMTLAENHLLSMGAEQVIFAALFHKKISKKNPDFYAAITKAWIIFHTEVLESVKDLGTRWLNEGLSFAKIKKRLLKLGITEEETNYAMQLVFNFPAPL